MVWVHNSEAAGPVPLNDPGLAVPVTPPRDDLTLDSPRGRSTVRANDPGGAESEESKGQRWRNPRKRINRLQLEYEERLSAVRIAYKEYFTMDDYSTDLNVDDDLCEDDEFWYGEDKVKLGDIPEALWLDAPTDVILQTIAHCTHGKDDTHKTRRDSAFVATQRADVTLFLA